MINPCLFIIPSPVFYKEEAQKSDIHGQAALHLFFWIEKIDYHSFHAMQANP